MSALSVQTMTGLLTQPYERGGETLELVLAADAGGFTPVVPYAFAEYKVRYQQDPASPRYVLYCKTPAPAAGVRVQLFFQPPVGPEGSSVVEIPGGTMAGASFAIQLPANADGRLRITKLKQLAAPLPGQGADHFGIVGLLGNIAKLTWVFGAEKDLIRSTMNDVRRQRHVAFAHDASLDALGVDLRVPRFPPRQYSFDSQTIALYHLNGSVANGGAVSDDTSRFGLPGHPGVNAAAQSGARGKFGSGFRFGPAGAILIPDHPDFALPPLSSFTAEIFFQVDAAGSADPALMLGKGPLNNAGNLTGAGWSVSLGSFRGFANNLRWALSDGAATVELFADADHGDGQFHHVAGILDGQTRQSRLVVDGRVAATADVSALGAVTNSTAISMGRASSGGQQFSGVLAEARLSRAARAEFDPALGESDTAYRKRIEIFRRWQLPDPVDLLATINDTIHINGDPHSFVLVEHTKPAATTTAEVRIVPEKIPAGRSMAVNGDATASEADVSGTAADEPAFRKIYLLRHDATAVQYGAVENNRLMQTATAQALDRLLNLLVTAKPPVAGALVISKSYDPADPGLHRVGRALRVSHTTLAPDQLAVFVHRAGFDFARNTGADVYASVAPGEALRIIVEPRPIAEVPADGSDAFAGHVFDLHVAQSALPVAGAYRWVVIPWGEARASLRPHPADALTMRTPVANRPHVRVSADAPGSITIRVEYELSRSTVTGTLDLDFTIDSLADAGSITATGSRTDTEAETIGVPGADVNPIYLVTSNAPVNFGADPNNKRMQIGLDAALVRLASLLGADAAALQVLKAFDPADTAFFKVGRAIRVTHPTLDPGRVGALAHQAGFDFVSRQGAQISGSVTEGDTIQIVNAADLSPLARELVVNGPVALRARFSSLPPGGSYDWSTADVGNGRGTFDFVLRPSVQFTPRKTGLVALSLTYLEADPESVNPYTFEIRLNDTLNVPATIIAKSDYDLLMNILNYFHPIGVEVITRQIRQHVVEVRENLLNAFPGYTFPDFRV